ncbi:MAG TPA: hypothetical protein VGM82_11380 [Gemmatimonadaceae bacterium]|jgi:hypothetical protein
MMISRNGMSSSHIARLAFAAALAGATPAALAAQMGDMPGMAGMHHDHPPVALTPAVKKQIDSVVKATVPLGAPGAAEAAGFHPAFGWIPTMGEHWVARALMMNGRQTDRGKPSQLMFSKIAGHDSLVGAAYGYMTAVGDTVRPVLFDGAPMWHEHQDLAPQGLTLVMLHVWFVPSPDGPFAGTNPNLPFWAVGLGTLDSARMHRDAAYDSRVRRASLALGAVVDTGSILSNLERRPETGAAIRARRDSVRALIPQLLTAQKSKDTARWDALAEQTAKQWDGMYAAYLGAARTKDGHDRIERYVEMLLGHHGE